MGWRSTLHPKIDLQMSLLLGLEPFQKLSVCDGWSKGILEFCSGPDLGLRLEVGTNLNNTITIYDYSYQEAAAIGHCGHMDL